MKDTMKPLKINSKYIYYEKTKRPLKKDYTPKDYEVAKTIYKVRKIIGNYVDLYCFELKKTKYRVARTEVKIGSIIHIDRWDGNGIPAEVIVTSIEVQNSSVRIKTNKGYFTFSKENCKKENIEFIWTCKGKEWEKMHMKWVDGNNYYLNPQ